MKGFLIMKESVINDILQNVSSLPLDEQDFIVQTIRKRYRWHSKRFDEVY